MVERETGRKYFSYALDGRRDHKERQHKSGCRSGKKPRCKGHLMHPKDPGDTIEEHREQCCCQQESWWVHGSADCSEQRVQKRSCKECEIDGCTPGTYREGLAGDRQRSRGELVAHRSEKSIQCFTHRPGGLRSGQKCRSEYDRRAPDGRSCRDYEIRYAWARHSAAEHSPKFTDCQDRQSHRPACEARPKPPDNRNPEP